ncbi:MAG: ATP-binding protein [Simkaniaceae bacterium]|nr:ATP-binding protein [Candidatus Sacchlamyda saccharinae]
MNPIKNPFSPGAGSPPPELVGRDATVLQAQILLGRIKEKRPEKSMLFIGLRGVGKTVLLNEIEYQAKNIGYKTIAIEAQEDKPLGSLLAPYLRRLLFELNRSSGASNKVKRAFAVLGSFIENLSLTLGDFTIKLGIDPEKGSADSGDLEIDLPNLFVAIGEAAEDRNTAVAILIDEIQYFSQKEIGALIVAMHKIQQHRLPIVLLGAGLPILPGLAGEAKSYAERLFNFPDIGILSKEDAAKALREPALAAGVVFDPAALDEIFQLTKGYPYFLQEWGYQAWNLAPSSPITLQIVQEATRQVVPRLDKNFFRVRFDQLTPREKIFLRSMAELGPGPYRASDIADLLGTKLASVSPVRASLIKKGMIYSPSYGELAFTVPLFDSFMIREIPSLSISV